MRTWHLAPFLLAGFTIVSACRRQQTNLSVDKFDVPQAMQMFYGNYDAKKQTSTVTFSKREPVRIAGEPMTVRALFHTLSGDPSEPSFVLLTYAVPTSDEKYYCHACAPTIGMVVFSQKGADWITTASNRAVTDAGGFGKPPTDPGLIQIGINHQAIRMTYVDEGNGETTAVLLILVPWNGTVNLGLERIVADDDTGACGAPESTLPCYANHRTFEFLRGEKTDYFEMELKLSGTDLPLSENKRSNRARAVLGLETLKFDNGKYVQVSRKGDLTYLDTWPEGVGSK